MKDFYVGENYIRESESTDRIPAELLPKFEQAESRRRRRNFFWNVIFPIALVWAVGIAAVIWAVRHHFLWGN